MSALYELLDNGTCDLAFNLSLYTQNYEGFKAPVPQTVSDDGGSLSRTHAGGR